MVAAVLAFCRSHGHRRFAPLSRPRTSALGGSGTGHGTRRARTWTHRGLLCRSGRRGQLRCGLDRCIWRRRAFPSSSVRPGPTRLLEGLEAAGRRVQPGPHTAPPKPTSNRSRFKQATCCWSPHQAPFGLGAGRDMRCPVTCCAWAKPRTGASRGAGFQSTRVHRLHGPSAEALRTWWRTHMEDEAWT